MLVSRWMMIVGGLILLLGVVLHFAPGAFNWFGKLPGDINIQGERTRIFIPITSMLLVSVVLSLLMNLFNR